VTDHAVVALLNGYVPPAAIYIVEAVLVSDDIEQDLMGDTCTPMSKWEEKKG
jgi:hypothetical protein